MFRKGNIPWNKGKKGLQVGCWRGKKMSAETRKKMSDARKGTKLSLGTRKKMSIAQKGRKITWGDKISASLKGRKASNETRKKLSEIRKKKPNRYWLGKRRTDMLGEKHPNWTGGNSKLIDKIRKYFKYRQWRSDVFTRDDFTCQECGQRGGDLEAHHIKQFSKIFKENNIKTIEQALSCEELWNINNGKTLCLKCHDKV